MKRIILFLLFFSLMFAQSNEFERPWEYKSWRYENENILIFLDNELWNSEEFHTVLEDLDLENVESRSIEVEKARYNYYLAIEAIDSCRLIGDKAFSYKMITAPHEITIELSLYEASDKIISECVSYPKFWKRTMNHSINALEEEYEKVVGYCIDAEEIYLDLEYAGICEYDYSYCSKIKELYLNCVGESSVGKFSPIYDVIRTAQEIKKKIFYQKPDVKEYSYIMNLIYSLNENEIDKFLFDSSNIFMNLEQEKNVKLYDLNAEKDRIDKKYSEMKNWNIEKIKSGSTIEGYLGEEVSYIPEMFYKIGEDIQSNKEEIDIAIIYYNDKNQGYLKNTLNIFEMCYNEYEKIDLELYILEEEIKEVVNEKKLESEDKINYFVALYDSKLLTSKTKLMLSYAEENYYNGEKSSKYGDKYFYYRESVRYINLAKSYQEKDSGEEEAFFISELNKIKIMINNAKTDGIDVGYEEQIVLNMEKSNMIDAVDILQEIRNGLIEKARMKYSYLEKERKEIRRLISISLGELEYYFPLMDNTEKDAFSNDGKIDYEKAIGKLDTISDFYYEIKAEIVYKLEKILLGNIEKKYDVYVRKCELGKNCEIVIDIELYNRYNISKKNYMMETQLPFEMTLYKSNIVSGYEYINDIVVEGKTLSIYFSEINPEQNYYIVFEKNQSAIEIKKMEYSAIGKSDGTADITYEYSITAKDNLGVVELPQYLGDLKWIKVNGIEIGKSIQTIEKGNNIIEFETFVSDAFSYEKKNIVVYSIGTTEKVSYEFEIIPKVDLTRIAVVIDEGQSESVKNLNIVSYSGHQIKNKKAMEIGRIYLELENLKKEENAVLKIEYIIDNSKEYVSNKLREMENVVSEEKEIEILQEVEDALDANETSAALKKIKELESIIEKKNNEEYKLQLKYQTLIKEIKNEIKDLEKCIGDTHDDEFIEKMKIRKGELEEILKEVNEFSVENTEILESVDNKWLSKESANFLKRMYKDLNSLKKQVIEEEIVWNISNEIQLLEQRIMEFEIKGDLELIEQILEHKEKVELFLSENENKKLSEKNEVITKINEEYNEINELIDNYEKQYNGAKGSYFEELFKYKPKDIRTEIGSLDKILKGSNEDIVIKETEWEKISKEMNQVMEYLNGESKRRISQIESLFLSMDMEENEKKEMQNAIYKLKEMDSKGEYISVLKACEKIVNGEYTIENDDFSRNVLLIVTILFIVAMTIYLLKDRIKFGKKENKEIKKLKRAE
ncbi:MAG: hypothetical protein PHU63_00595 [Candidatus ainarchaeum sp.]|nr:hypothetical protein [Candidatus ainarchaeum sp.]